MNDPAACRPKKMARERAISILAMWNQSPVSALSAAAMGSCLRPALRALT